MMWNLILITSAIAVFATAQVQQRPSQYTITALGTLGGTFSAAQSINNRGWMAGDANLPDDQTEHAVVWRNGVMTDLGTLGGLNSIAGVINEKGLVAGFGQTSTVDPLGENWGLIFACSPTGGAPCDGYQNLVLGFVWQNGVLIRLPTVGGNNALGGNWPAGMNDKGQIVGTAETATQDPSCVAPQVLDFEGVIWGPHTGEIHELRPYLGDSVSGAVAINDNGQAVGGSGSCAPPNGLGSVHALLWEDGLPRDLGNLGGTISNFAFDINNRSQIVGFSNLPGDITTHAFIWQNGVMTDLGTLPGDFASFAYAINDLGQVVGQSIDQNGNPRSFLWQNGVMSDLNSLTPPGSPLYIVQPDSINSKGEIVGIAFDQSTGETPAFLAVPVPSASVPLDRPEREKLILPESIRQFLKNREGFGNF